ADGGHLEFAPERPAVERLDVLQLVAEAQVAGVELVVGQGVEHEGVVGVGAVADGDELLRHGALPVRGQFACAWARNRRVTSSCGASKICGGGPDSATRPSCITWTVVATWRAKPMACVTTTIVCPERARSVMTPSTSAAMRGSRALVGSSNRIASGL